MGRPNFAELKPWAGLIAGFGAAGLQHQVVSDSLHFDCSYGHGNTAIGLIAFIVIAIGAWISWSALGVLLGSQESRRFVSHMSLLAAALSALFVGLMTLAGWILPACAP
jgi:hypothetical protein